MVSAVSAGEFLTQMLWGLGCLVGMIVFSIIAVIIGNGKKEE